MISNNSFQKYNSTDKNKNTEIIEHDNTNSKKMILKAGYWKGQACQNIGRGV